MPLDCSRTIVGLGGSLRTHSFSRAAMNAGLGFAETLGCATQVLDLRKLDLPMYVPDQPISRYPKAKQASIAVAVDAFRRAKAMLWVSPIYHGSMSGVFKNALDFMDLLATDSRPYLQGCAVGLIAVSGSAPLGAMADCAHELRGWLAPTRLTLHSQDFSEAMELCNPNAKRRMERLVSELTTFAAL